LPIDLIQLGSIAEMELRCLIYGEYRERKRKDGEIWREIVEIVECICQERRSSGKGIMSTTLHDMT
jgi:hypothetical protein